MRIQVNGIRWFIVTYFIYAAVLPDDAEESSVERVPSLDSMSSRFTNDSSDQQLGGKIFPKR